MRYFFGIFILTIVVLLNSGMASAVNLAQVRFNDESADTTRLTELLVAVDGMELNSPQSMVAEFGRRLIGTPYVANTLEGDEEMLTVNLSGLDCTTFVETVIALAKTVEARRTSWRDFLYNLEQIRYRGGSINGYASRLHYVSDWVVDNTHRGNITEVTDRIYDANYQIKTLDFMTSNRDKYPALSDSATYERMKSTEIGYRSHRYPYIKSANVGKANLREGDVVAITTSMQGLDVTHMGIIVMVDGKAHLLHASSKAGKVIIDPLSLFDYLRRNKSATGIRVIRIAN